jgi:hypothetical protein
MQFGSVRSFVHGIRLVSLKRKFVTLQPTWSFALWALIRRETVRCHYLTAHAVFCRVQMTSCLGQSLDDEKRQTV